MFKDYVSGTAAHSRLRAPRVLIPLPEVVTHPACCRKGTTLREAGGVLSPSF